MTVTLDKPAMFARAQTGAWVHEESARHLTGSYAAFLPAVRAKACRDVEG